MVLKEKMTSLHEYKKAHLDFSRKGLVHGLGKNNSKFFFFCLNVDREKVFGKVLKRKEAFLDYKKRRIKKPQNLNFSKGVRA